MRQPDSSICSESCSIFALLRQSSGAGVVESLINSGRQIDAVHLIHAFQLTERFHPVPLLKTYLKDLRRNSQGAGAKSEGAAIASVLVLSPGSTYCKQYFYLLVIYLS